MTITITPHLNFRGNARQALSAYHAVFGGDLVLVTYRDAGRDVPDVELDQLVFGQVMGKDGFSIMGYDVPAAMPWHAGDNAVFIMAQFDDADVLAAAWRQLAEGAAIREPLAPSAWSPLSGALKDRFGVAWVLSVPARRE